MPKWATLIVLGAALPAPLFAQTLRPAQSADSASGATATTSATLTPEARAAIAAVEALGLEVESIDSVSVYSQADIAVRQRLAFSLGYTVGQIREDPIRGVAGGLGRQIDRLFAEGPVPTALRGAATDWAQASASNDVAAIGLADALQDALEDAMRATGAIEDLFAKLGSLALSIKTQADTVFQLDVAERLYRLTGEAQYRAQADLQRLESIEGRAALPLRAGNAARQCRAVMPIHICREDIATAFESAGQHVVSDGTDEAQSALRPVVAEFLSR